MSNENTFAQPSRVRHSLGAGRLAWPAILIVAAIGGNLLGCLMPFAALAVAFAGTMRLRPALGAMLCVWIVNQIIGFGLFHYPHTANTVLWGLAMGGAALVATCVASMLLRTTASRTRPVSVVAALVGSFAAFEVALFAAALFLGGLATFTPAIIGEIALSTGLWFVGMIVLNEIVALLAPRWHGAAPRLVRA
jgi:hypothetical protein